MTDNRPKISHLQPTVLPDNRRVTMEMVVDDLPTTFSNVLFTMPDEPAAPPEKPDKSDPDAASPYPNIELSILNSRRQQISSLVIIEHMEKQTALTLHLLAPDPNETYTARAEMTYDDEVIDVVEVPFRLHQVN